MCLTSAQARRETPPQEVATLDQIRPRTPDQKMRAEFLSSDLGMSILEVKRFRVYAGPPQVEPSGWERALLAWQRQVCDPSAVLVGRPVATRTFLTKGETSLFTDVDVAVDLWIRPSIGNKTVLLSFQGGRVKVAGELLEADFGTYLETEQRYVLFLNLVKAAGGAYLTAGPAFPVAGGTVITSWDPPLREQGAFLKNLSATAAQCKGQYRSLLSRR